MSKKEILCFPLNPKKHSSSCRGVDIFTVDGYINHFKFPLIYITAESHPCSTDASCTTQGKQYQSNTQVPDASGICILHCVPPLLQVTAALQERLSYNRQFGHETYRIYAVILPTSQHQESRWDHHINPSCNPTVQVDKNGEINIQHRNRTSHPLRF